MNDRMKAAVIGGAVLGVLSAIPFVNFVNICCCGWALVGGALATYLYVKSSATPVRPGDGAMLGLLAGGIGVVIYLIIGVPINYLVGNAMQSFVMNMMSGNMTPEQAEMMRQQLEASRSLGPVLLNALLAGVGLLIFSTIGGALGVPLFEKRKGDTFTTPPPPTGNFGGPAAGGGSTGFGAGL